MINSPHKRFYSKNSDNPTYALNNLNLDVQDGEIFGLLGPNGAGKTTFLNILAGTVIKSSGNVNVWGLVDESQSPSYTTVSDTQSPDWDEVAA